MIEGSNVGSFYAFLKSVIPEFPTPEIEEVISVRCKVTDPLLVLDEDKETINPNVIVQDDRVLVTFHVVHWVIKKEQKNGYKFHLLSIRHLPFQDPEQMNEVVYTGPDF